MSEYTCCGCKNTYLKPNNEEWNDFKAAEEFLNNEPEAKNDATAILCEDCYNEFYKWFVTLTDEDKKMMREKYKNELLKL